MNLVVFFDKAAAGAAAEALSLLDQLALLPGPSAALLDRRAAFARGAPAALARNYPALILAAMECTFRAHGDLKRRCAAAGSGVPGAAGDATGQKLAEYRERANLLVTFSGLLADKLPGDIGARLARMEVMMI